MLLFLLLVLPFIAANTKIGGIRQDESMFDDTAHLHYGEISTSITDSLNLHERIQGSAFGNEGLMEKALGLQPNFNTTENLFCRPSLLGSLSPVDSTCTSISNTSYHTENIPASIYKIPPFVKAENTTTHYLEFLYLHGAIADFKIRLMTYNSSVPAPTLDIRPGGSMEIVVKNSLPRNAENPTSVGSCWPPPGVNLSSLPSDASPINYMNNPHESRTTAIHTHGLHVSPYEDDAHLSVHPGETVSYGYNIPNDHPAGMLFYHPHHHGSVTSHLSQGATGLLLVRGAMDRYMAAIGAREKHLVVQLLQLYLDDDVYINDPLPYACPEDGGAPTSYPLNVLMANGRAVAYADSKLTYIPLPRSSVNPLSVLNPPANTSPTTVDTPRRIPTGIDTISVQPGERIWLRILNGFAGSSIGPAFFTNLSYPTLANERLFLLESSHVVVPQSVLVTDLDGIDVVPPIPFRPGYSAFVHHSSTKGGLLVAAAGRMGLLIKVPDATTFGLNMNDNRNGINCVPGSILAIMRMGSQNSSNVQGYSNELLRFVIRCPSSEAAQNMDTANDMSIEKGRHVSTPPLPKRFKELKSEYVEELMDALPEIFQEDEELQEISQIKSPVRATSGISRTKATYPPLTRWTQPISESSIIRHRKFSLTMSGSNSSTPRNPYLLSQVSFYINDRAYDPFFVDTVVQVGTCEEWTLHNPTRMVHPFHIHSLSFQVVSMMNESGINLIEDENGYFCDTLLLPGNFTGTIRLCGYYPGPSLMHCHHVGHEAGGMMANLLFTEHRSQRVPISRGQAKMFQHHKSQHNQHKHAPE